jgi:hypothetical protein
MPMKSTVKILLDPYMYSACSKKSHDLGDRSRLTQKLFFAIFRTFTRGTTDLFLPFAENVKTVKNRPALMSNRCFRFFYLCTIANKWKSSGTYNFVQTGAVG